LNKKNLFSTHLELAEYYENRKQYTKAFEEYKELLYILPYETDLYINAAKMLLKMNSYLEALKILNKSLEYRETAFALQWIDQILLMNQKFTEGITYLKKVYSLKPTDVQLLYNLALAYFMIGKSTKANEIINQLAQQSPSSPYLKKLEEFQSRNRLVK
jgi:predicted Zn-dependent protease